ncbi:MAG: SSS family solute:Na+ symporter [Candidatus Krumholzibacteriia bacterium]|jgi:SSS family solute:Na+ symporter
MLAGLVYLAFLLFIVIRLFRFSTSSAVDFIVAGRRLTLPAFTASLVTTWYGGILGVGEYTWQYGVSNWLVFGVPYYLYAALFAVFLARRARRSQMLTVPDMLDHHYGRPTALFGAGTIFVMTAPAAYVLMLGVLLNFATGWPIWVGVVAGTALSISYVFRGGLRAIVATDMVQFILMFVGFAVLVGVCVTRFGGWEFLRDNLPAGHLQWDGGLGWQAIAVWYVIALSTLVEPAFYQRCFAAESEETAKNGIFWAIGFWIVFDFLTTTAGLYARALLPDLANPVQAFPALAAHVLPSFWQGVFTVGMLATIMSTVDSYAFICSVTLGRDLIERWRTPRGEKLADEATLPAIRWSLLATAIVAIALALISGSVIQLWKTLGSVGTPILFLPMALAQWGRVPSGQRAVRSMIFSGSTALVWLILGNGSAWLGVEAIFPGLAVSALILFWPGAGQKKSALPE